MNEDVKVEYQKIPRPTKRRCGRCGFAKMSDDKIINPKREVDLCRYVQGQPRRIVSLTCCPKKVIALFDTVEDRKKGEFEG